MKRSHLRESPKKLRSNPTPRFNPASLEGPPKKTEKSLMAMRLPSKGPVYPHPYPVPRLTTALKHEEARPFTVKELAGSYKIVTCRHCSTHIIL